MSDSPTMKKVYAVTGPLSPVVLLLCYVHLVWKCLDGHYSLASVTFDRVMNFVLIATMNLVVGMFMMLKGFSEGRKSGIGFGTCLGLRMSIDIGRRTNATRVVESAALVEFSDGMPAAILEILRQDGGSEGWETNG